MWPSDRFVIAYVALEQKRFVTPGVCQRGNASKAVDRFSTAMVSRDLSRLRTSRTIMLCGKELAVNACWLLRTEIRHSVSTGYSIPLLHTLVWCDQILWTSRQCNISVLITSQLRVKLIPEMNGTAIRRQKICRDSLIRNVRYWKRLCLS